MTLVITLGIFAGCGFDPGGAGEEEGSHYVPAAEVEASQAPLVEAMRPL